MQQLRKCCEILKLLVGAFMKTGRVLNADLLETVLRMSPKMRPQFACSQEKTVLSSHENASEWERKDFLRFVRTCGP